MICAGCGLELPPPSSRRRGRPARFHNGACRQRARRARLADRAGDALTALDAIETQVSALRHAILNGQRLTSEPITRLTRATDDLAQAMTHLRGEPGEHRASVTGPVTAPDPPDRLDEPRGDESPHTREPTSSNTAAVSEVTKPVTESRPARAKPRRRTRPSRPAPLDLDTVRLEHGDSHGTWRVLAGDSAQPTLVGFLEPTYSGASTKRWIARTAPGWTLVPGGSSPTRKLALLRLLDNHQRAAGT